MGTNRATPSIVNWKDYAAGKIWGLGLHPQEEHWPTTNELIAQARANREGEIYPTPERLLANLPVVLRGLCDHVLTGDATVDDVAYALASIIDVIENVQHEPEQPDTTLH